ncbi:MAG: hypothetical protein QF530_11235 [SAR202 cluster bacterium]|jgi:hypothetical protein|nr:hypothetical protein [SAR202 cluster bacterium]
MNLAATIFTEGNTRNQESVPEGVLYASTVEPQSRGRGFFEGIREVRRTHPYGARERSEDLLTPLEDC